MGNAFQIKKYLWKKKWEEKEEFGILKKKGMEWKWEFLGDKHYRESEHFTTYYKEGGLIPGSTNSINYNKTQSRKAYNFYETLDLSKQ